MHLIITSIEVIKALGHAEALLIFGPGEAKQQLSRTTAGTSRRDRSRTSRWTPRTSSPTRRSLRKSRNTSTHTREQFLPAAGFLHTGNGDTSGSAWPSARYRLRIERRDPFPPDGQDLASRLPLVVACGNHVDVSLSACSLLSRPLPSLSRVVAQTARTGREIYEAACAACHGIDGRGGSAAAADYPLVPPDFTDCNFATREPATDWHVVARHGGPARAFSPLMPAFDEALSAEEVQLAVSHARTFCPDPAWPRGELNFPRALVTSKAFPEDEWLLTVVADGGAVTNKFAYERRLGARSMFEVTVPARVLRARTGRLDRWSGRPGIRLQASDGAQRVYAGRFVSAAAELVVPTGSTERGLGSGTTVVETFLAIGQRLPARVFLQMQSGGALPCDREPRRRSVLADSGRDSRTRDGTVSSASSHRWWRSSVHERSPRARPRTGTRCRRCTSH